MGKYPVFCGILEFSLLCLFRALYDKPEFLHNLFPPLFSYFVLQQAIGRQFVHFYFFLSMKDTHIVCLYLYLFQSSYDGTFFRIRCGSR